MNSPDARELVVVGIDGSEASQAALGWAVRYGRKTEATVRAVTAWRIDPAANTFAASEDSFERESREALDRTLARVREREPDFPVETRLQRGEPAAVLLEHAQQAHLLVFGGKQRGPVAGILVGSVANHFLKEAPCPVVLVGADGRSG